ncbi:type II toxin-antitoxin system HipA family toxin [Nocardioides sp. cx-173]|uniref:type II toxin-antitoxin system HipA family toxin n=1 Tax=Nocardioides sp. cx-173 TaxID=2898796 RepID=UPI001E5E494A|nr:HipA domain-containing protein [Nocardioides sp. cx-173]MCD4525225.1 HipA domain-containing protein [Nocardioides sp. cx-173]UGB40972.1 HipA domain-containing protein [Nocardioides sp. cx-173]
MSREPLDIWLYGVHIATITASFNERLELTWTTDAEEAFGRGSRVLSAKLPIGERIIPAATKNYIDGLLPEGNARVNHALAAAVPPDDSLALVRAYGRDTPGAAQIVPSGAGDPTRAGRYEPLTIDEVAHRIRNADRFARADPTGVTGESSTLPGMVPKITLHRDGEGIWHSCKGGAASTWIIKRAGAPEAIIGDTIDTEVLSLDLARKMGLTTVQAEVLDFGDTRAIAVPRYDRDFDSPHLRVHQEDLAQAIGLNTLDPNRKFQWGSAMPSLKHAHDVLAMDGGDPDPLLRLVTFSHLVGNTDMHAKNISFIRHPDGRVALSPAYDIAMHLHHARENQRSALDVNGKHFMADIDVSDLVAEGVRWGLTERRARALVTGAARELAEALDDTDPSRYGGVSEEAWSLVRERTHRAADSGPTQVRPHTKQSGKPVKGHTRRRGPRRPS